MQNMSYEFKFKIRDTKKEIGKIVNVIGGKNENIR